MKNLLIAKILEIKFTDKLINGLSKTFFRQKFLGITEYLKDKFTIRETVMLIFNNKLSVSTITTHLPIKLVSKQITKSYSIKNKNNK